MYLGDTLEEQYLIICAINRKLKKWGRIGVALYATFLVFFLPLVIKSYDNTITAVFLCCLVVPIGVIFAVFGAKVYCWAWLSFCQKYIPRKFSSSIFNSAERSMVDGFLLYGNEGAKGGLIGVFVVFAFVIWIYLLKGHVYYFKYKNLENKLKHTLDEKQPTIA